MKASVKKHGKTGYYVGFVGDPEAVEVIAIKLKGDWEAIGLRGFGVTFLNDCYTLTAPAKAALDEAVEQYPDPV